MDFKESLSNRKYDKKTNCPKKEEERQVKESIARYKNLSHDQLMQEFLTRTAEMKRRGELSNENLNTLYLKLEPLLNEEQKTTLKNLLNKI